MEGYTLYRPYRETGSKFEIVGESSATKPLELEPEAGLVVPCANFSMFWELDTGDIYYLIDGDWKKVGWNA